MVADGAGLVVVEGGAVGLGGVHAGAVLEVVVRDGYQELGGCIAGETGGAGAFQAVLGTGEAVGGGGEVVVRETLGALVVHAGAAVVGGAAGARVFRVGVVLRLALAAVGVAGAGQAAGLAAVAPSVGVEVVPRHAPAALLGIAASAVLVADPARVVRDVLELRLARRAVVVAIGRIRHAVVPTLQRVACVLEQVEVLVALRRHQSVLLRRVVRPRTPHPLDVRLRAQRTPEHAPVCRPRVRVLASVASDHSLHNVVRLAANYCLIASSAIRELPISTLRASVRVRARQARISTSTARIIISKIAERRLKQIDGLQFG